MMWILVAIFGILSAVLLLGKGSFLIAGYNTASEEEKKKIQGKASVPGHRSVHGRSHASFGAWSCIGGTGSGLVSGTGFRVFIYRHNRCDSAVQYYLCSKTTGRRKNRDGEWETAERMVKKIINRCSVIFYTSAGCRYRYFLVTGDVKPDLPEKK